MFCRAASTVLQDRKVIVQRGHRLCEGGLSQVVASIFRFYTSHRCCSDPAGSSRHITDFPEDHIILTQFLKCDSDRLEVQTLSMKHDVE